MFKAKRRTAVSVAAVATVLLAAALVITLTQGSGQASGVTYIDGNNNQMMYAAGHRPLAPDFTGTSLTGAPIRLASYRGKVVVLNFWGSWCGPCRGEGPTLAVLSEQYRSRGVAFLGDDVGDTPANALAFTRSVGITYPSVNDAGYAVVQDFGRVVPVSDTPTTVVIDRTGHIAGLVIGAVTYQAMTTLLNDVAASLWQTCTHRGQPRPGQARRALSPGGPPPNPRTGGPRSPPCPPRAGCAGDGGSSPPCGPRWCCSSCSPSARCRGRCCRSRAPTRAGCSSTSPRTPRSRRG
ncbi:MAG TPA: TlpA disulfide reductase family protein [Trebonia sp.]|nr:TlpA disulfide reductase family protein [Trebonia sp.]